LIRVRTAWPSAIEALEGEESVTRMVSSASFTRSPRIPTSIVLEVTPGGKVRVPPNGM